MTHWIRFKHENQFAFGTLTGQEVQLFEGDIFNHPTDTGKSISIDEITLLTPCIPTKMLALWNNFHATAEKNNLPNPSHPWYFVKTSNSFAPVNSVIRRPVICSGKILFEGELGIVIGKSCKDVPLEDIKDHVFGYTCVNDVTAVEYLFNEESFAHWTRSKCFDGFGVFGPSIATGIEPDDLVIKTYLVGPETQERQNYPVSDMIYSPHEIVSKLSYDMTLNPGDIIACGTSLGAGAMKDGWNVEVVIDGVGKLINTYRE